MANINGVVIKPLRAFEDSRGSLIEIHRRDEDGLEVLMGYISHTRFGCSRGPHEHRHQTDLFVFAGPGDFVTCLWDNRKESETYGQKIRLIVGESNMVSMIVPPGVIHGYKSISPAGSVSINLPDKLYRGEGRTEEVDEIRYENLPDCEYKIE